MTVTILTGDTRTVLPTLPADSVQSCVTSPPYFGLRDYGHTGQIGLEQTPEAYVSEMVALFREVRRVLKDDGTMWLNLGDTYGSGKNLLGVPWRVAFALQSDGWFLRSDIIWHKPNPMPESVTDRPTKAHEYVFLLTKSARYFYDAAAVAEEGVVPVGTRRTIGKAKDGGSTRAEAMGRDASGNEARGYVHVSGIRNARTVWSITTQPFKGAHFATMPPELARRCILAGSKPGDMVLDPFGGAGTTGLVADRLGRHATLIELNPTYAEMARTRIQGDAPLFADVQEAA